MAHIFHDPFALCKIKYFGIVFFYFTVRQEHSGLYIFPGLKPNAASAEHILQLVVNTFRLY